MRETGSFLARSSKNQPGLKIFFVLYYEKIYPVQKRIEGRSEIVFPHFFKFQRLILQLLLFECVLFEYFHSLPVSPKAF